MAILAIIVILAAVGAAVYFSRPQPQPAAGATGTLTVGSTEFPANGVSPYNTALDTGFDIEAMIYEGLTSQDPNGKLLPGLASSWSANPDYTVWTFRIRNGVKFHDGTAVNASAIKSALEVSIKSRLGPLVLGPYVKDMTVLNQSALQFNLKVPFEAFTYALSGSPSLIVSPSSYLRNPNQTGTLVNIGTGPWRQVQWIPNDRVILEANPDYWNPSRIPKVKTFIWKFFTDSNAMVLSLKSGAIDVAYLQIPQNQVQTLSQDPNLRFVRNVYPFTNFLALNVRFKPLDNLYVRKAIAYAIDYDKILRIENATRAYSVFPPQIFGQFDAGSQKNFTYNPTYARQLMAKAGYPNGYNGTITLSYPPLQFGPEISDVVTVVQQNLADIGLKVTLNVIDSATLLAGATRGQLQMAMFNGGTLTPDPDYMATITYQIGQLNADIRWGFANQTATSWVAQARSATSIQDRVAWYHKIQDTFDSQPSHLIFLYNNIHYVFFNKKVQGIASMGVSVGYEVDWTQVAVSQ